VSCGKCPTCKTYARVPKDLLKSWTPVSTSKFSPTVQINDEASAVMTHRTHIPYNEPINSVSIKETVGECDTKEDITSGTECTRLRECAFGEILGKCWNEETFRKICFRTEKSHTSFIFLNAFSFPPPHFTLISTVSCHLHFLNRSRFFVVEIINNYSCKDKIASILKVINYFTAGN
jgi:hypothetical protein